VEVQQEIDGLYTGHAPALPSIPSSSASASGSSSPSPTYSDSQSQPGYEQTENSTPIVMASSLSSNSFDPFSPSNLFENSSSMPTPSAPPANSVYSQAEFKAEIKDGFEVGQVSVSEPEMRGTGLSKYHAYKIIAANSGVDHVFRRYRDFVWLRTILVKLYPGLFVPPLPPKKIIGNQDTLFVNERRFDIERFLNRLVAVPAFLQSSPLQAFLTRAQMFEEAVKDLEKSASERSIDDMLKSYRDFYPDHVATRLPDKAEQDLAAMTEFLQSCEQKLSGLLETAALLDGAVSQQVSHLSKLNMFLHSIDTVEKGYPARPDPPRLDVLVNFHQWLEASKQIAPAYSQHLLQTCKFELQDIQAFVELLKVRADYAALAKKANEKAKKWRQPDTIANTDKLEKQKDQDLRRDEQLTALVETIGKLIFAEQFKRFWIEKTLAFKKAIALFSKAQMTVCHQLNQMWETMHDEATEK